MKRQFKFRFWNISEKYYLPDYEIREMFSLDLLYNTSGNFVIQQFTGLTDKNGKEIYEGDIIELEDGGIYPILFVSGMFMADLSSSGESLIPLIEIEYFRIIGNIFENPELLK